jgi:hypothetical protein
MLVNPVVNPDPAVAKDRLNSRLYIGMSVIIIGKTRIS